MREACKSVILRGRDFLNVQGSWREVRQGYSLDATGLLKSKELERGELQLACNPAGEK